ncbi:MAG: hypothetical protein K9N51_02455 [Candidatus Pacebacteria bacterium]|nr:hypothetical protein [Candidatus Paceibacterota bacterium]
MPDNASISSPTQDASAIAMRIASRGPRTAGSVEAAALSASNTNTPQVVASSSADTKQPETSTQETSKSVEQKTVATAETPTATAATDTQATALVTANATATPNVSREDEDRKVAELLGLSEVEPSTLQDALRKLKASSRESHRVVDKLHRIEKMLESKKVKLVEDAQGNPDLAQLPGYDPKVDIEDIEALISDELVDSILTADDKKALLLQLVKKSAGKVIEKYPKANPNTRSVLPEKVQLQVYAELVQSKLSDGSERFPGIQSPEYKRLMGKIFHDPKNQARTVWMHQSPENYRMGIQDIYNMAYRALGNVQKTAPQSAQPQAQQNNAGVHVSVSGSGGPAIQQMRTVSGSDAAKSMAERIARAKIL